jgi:DNA polymerase-4
VAKDSDRGVVSTASYEARKFGIRSAMPVFQAKQNCDHLVIVPGNREKYRADSRRIMDILFDFSPLVEPVSIDEAYMDIRGCERLFGSPLDMARAVKKTIQADLGLTASVGIAPLKFLSKIASDMNKPDGLTLIPPDRVDDFIRALPVQKVPGIGKTAMNRMQALQIKTLGDVGKYPISILTQKFGRMGQRLMDLSKGIDPSGVSPQSLRKSISSETTLARDIFDFETIKRMILDRSQEVGRELRKKNLTCETVFVKLKFSDFSQLVRQKKTGAPVCSSADIFDEAMVLYKTISLKKKIRLVGVGVTSLKDKNAPVQLLLLEDPGRQKKHWESVDMAVDSISEKFGSHIVKRASLNTLTQRRNRDVE